MVPQATLDTIVHCRIEVDRSTKEALINLLRAQNRYYVDRAREHGKGSDLYEYLSARIQRVEDLADRIEKESPGDIPLTGQEWRLLSTTHRDYVSNSPFKHPVPGVTAVLMETWANKEGRDRVDINNRDHNWGESSRVIFGENTSVGDVSMSDPDSLPDSVTTI